MRKLLFILVSGLFLMACDPIPGEEVKVTGNCGKIKVERLFTVDGVTVYRFRDQGELIYFTNTTGLVKYETADGEGNTTVHRTLCNGEIKTENPEN